MIYDRETIISKLLLLLAALAVFYATGASSPLSMIVCGLVLTVTTGFYIWNYRRLRRQREIAR